jgi:hypothetical protein
MHRHAARFRPRIGQFFPRHDSPHRIRRVIPREPWMASK